VVVVDLALPSLEKEGNLHPLTVLHLISAQSLQLASPTVLVILHISAIQMFFAEDLAAGAALVTRRVHRH
jgi:hypothetical protein